MNESKKPNTLDGIELYKLSNQLRKVLICCILNFMVLTNDQINNMFNQSNNSYLS